MVHLTSKYLLLALCLAAPGAPGGALADVAAEGPDLTTPRRALRAFIDPARAGDYAAASRALDLAGLPGPRRAADGALRARQLKFVLDQTLWIDWEKVSDDPAGDPADGAGADVLGTVALGGAPVPVRLTRSADGTWRLGRGIVEAAPRLYEAGGPAWIVDRLPPALVEVRLLDVQAWQWLGLAAGLLLALLVAGAGGAVARRLALRIARRTSFSWDDRLVDAFSAPARLLLGIATFAAALRALHLAVPAQAGADRLLRIASIVAFCWAAVRALRFAAAVVDDRLARGADQAGARARRTQLMVLRRIADAVVAVLGCALVLLQFDAMRAIGTSLLASAGVAGIVVGLAAQRSIATVLAGLQLSLAQPVRVGDVVIVEGEWGTVEEITLTYVVVRIWDLRRLVVPITRFLEAPFQNWTRSGSDILGTAFVYADYGAPVEQLRAELARFVASRPEWDGKVVGLQVTNATERTLELRALVSSADAGRAWDLRCAVREHLVGYLRRLEDGRHLPRTRIEAPARRPARNEAVEGPRRPAVDVPS
jgi:small-conductance mechanosensitive channel